MHSGADRRAYVQQIGYGTATHKGKKTIILSRLQDCKNRIIFPAGCAHTGSSGRKTRQ